MEKSRTYNSIVNSLFGIGASAITVILNFFVRIVLVRQLGEEINGLHNLFQSILSVMTLMELGISSAMIIHLYEPVKENKVDMIKGIMAFYRRVYRIIAGVFGGVCIFTAIFLMDTIVTTTIDMVRVRLYFLIFGFSFVLNYLTYYKRSLLFAEQKNRVSMGVTAVCEVIFRSIQIVLLILYKQYIIFLVLWVIEKATSNIICAIYVDKRHPYLKHNSAEISKDKKTDIFNTVKPLIINQAANTVSQSAKSILISLLLGNVSVVGYYGNYQLIINMVEMIYTQFGGAFTSSFGNLSVDNDHKRMMSAYKKSAFIMNWFAAIMCAGFFVCIQDFITIAFGKSFVLDTISVISLLLNLIFYLINIPIISIQNAMGLHNLDAKHMIIQAVLSIVLAYIGGVFYGAPGIFIGLLIPLIVFTTVRKGIVITNKAFEMSRIEYLKFVSKELMKICVTIIITSLVCCFIPIKYSLLSFIVKGAVAVVLGIMIPAVLSVNTQELKYTLSLVSSLLNKIKSRI